MLKTAALLFLLQISGSLACSCFHRAGVVRDMCDERTANIVSIKIDAIIEGEKPMDSWYEDSFPPADPAYAEEHATDGVFEFASSPVTTRPSYYSSKRVVSATVLRAFKGSDLSTGDQIEIESIMSDGLCGVGYSLNPGRELVVRTGPNPTRIYLGLCDMMLYDGYGGDGRYQSVQQVLENHDCECDVRRCKLREGRFVFRGICMDPDAWCAEDGEGICKWFNAASIESCSRYY